VRNLLLPPRRKAEKKTAAPAAYRHAESEDRLLERLAQVTAELDDPWAAARVVFGTE
jgi:hypothetical protein